jgi:sugar phosphate isomerase/epimerase
MIRLSAFADEISADLDEQLAVLHSEHIRFIDLRGVWNTNVLDLSDQQITDIKQKLDRHGIGVAAIASPIGKVAIDTPFDEHLQRFERAIALAQFFHTPFIRIFSFYPPVIKVDAKGSIRPSEVQDDSSVSSLAGAKGDASVPTPLHPTPAPTREAREVKGASEGKDVVDQTGWRIEVLRRLRELTILASNANLILLHENEKDIYGDTIARCTDILQNINDPHFQAIFDPANFIQSSQTPYPDAYQALRPWLRYIHVKDALADGTVVAAGEGLARWPELLQQLRMDGYDGFFSLEPHLALAGQYRGFSGPELFHRASRSFQHLLEPMNWEYA